MTWYEAWEHGGDYMKAWHNIMHEHPEVFARWMRENMKIYPNYHKFMDQYRKMVDILLEEGMEKVTDEQRDAMIAQIGTGHTWLWMMDQLFCPPFEDRVFHTFEIRQKQDIMIEYPHCTNCGFEGMGWYPL